MNSPVKLGALTQPSLRWMLGNVSRTIAFGFGSGLSPFAPGTVGTLWAWVVFLIGNEVLSKQAWLWIISGGLVLGCWICGKVSEELGGIDFGGIVWDEILAFWLILALIMPASIPLQVLAFALFRFLDAVKPGPIGKIDRYFKSLEKNHGPNTAKIGQILWHGFGIIADDLAAAFFTLLVIVLGNTLMKYLL